MPKRTGFGCSPGFMARGAMLAHAFADFPPHHDNRRRTTACCASGPSDALTAPAAAVSQWEVMAEAPRSQSPSECVFGRTSPANTCRRVAAIEDNALDRDPPCSPSRPSVPLTVSAVTSA